MSRGVLIVIVIVLVLAIAGVSLALFWKPGILGNKNSNQVAQNTNAATNTTPPNTNTGLTNYTAEVLGSKQLDARVKYRGADIPIDRVEVTNGYSGYSPAPEGKKYVYVYFEREVLQQQPDIHFWMTDEIKLLDSDSNSYTFDRSQLASKQMMEKGSETYFTFTVPDAASGFKLRFVRPEEDVSVDLGI